MDNSEYLIIAYKQLLTGVIHSHRLCGVRKDTRYFPVKTELTKQEFIHARKCKFCGVKKFQKITIQEKGE